VSLWGNYIIYPLINGLFVQDAQLIVLTEVSTFTKNVRKGKIIRKIDPTTLLDFKYKLGSETRDSVFGAKDVNIVYNSFLNSFRIQVFFKRTGN
jgi:hypothetical protein